MNVGEGFDSKVSDRNGPGRPTARRRPGLPAEVRAGLKQPVVVWADR